MEWLMPIVYNRLKSMKPLNVRTSAHQFYEIMDDSSIKKIYSIYEKDFEVFDYKSIL
jgi:hypothetical protein